MKIALITPYTPDGNFVPPLGLLTIAAILEKKGHNVKVFDQNIDQAVLSSITAFSPDLAGFTAVTSSVISAHDLAKSLKEHLPELTIVFGGPHPTTMSNEVISWSAVDFVVSGEGEASMEMLSDWLSNQGGNNQIKKIPNLYHKIGGKPVFTFSAETLHSEQLDALPLPAYHLLDVEHISTRIRHGLFRKAKKVLPYMASRGCPHNCTFCCRVMGRKVRRKDPKLVIRDIEYLVEKYDLDGIYIEDDNFTSSKEYALKILNGIIDRQLPISIKFANGVRIDTLDEELLETMRRAGCHSLGFGLESGSARILKQMKKSLNLDAVRENVKLIKSHGFLTGANMILGYPGETPQDIWDSYNYFQSLDLDSIAVVNLIPFPGTVVRKICEENGFLTPEASSWNNYYFDIKSPKILIETPDLPAEELRKIMKKVFFKLYFDKSRMLTLLKNMSFNDILAGGKLFAEKMFK